MLHTLAVWNVMTGEMVPSGTARIACALELPDGSGWVRLQSSDPMVQPSINYRYLHNENDMRRMRPSFVQAWVKLACGILESEAYQGISEGRIAPTDDILGNDDELDSWIRQTLGSSRHVSGTCRIGPDGDAMAVTDQQCRVRGVNGLWVADITGTRAGHHAAGHPRQHQRHRHNDWRAGGGLGGRALTGQRRWKQIEHSSGGLADGRFQCRGLNRQH